MWSDSSDPGFSGNFSSGLDELIPCIFLITGRHKVCPYIFLFLFSQYVMLDTN